MIIILQLLFFENFLLIHVKPFYFNLVELHVKNVSSIFNLIKMKKIGFLLIAVLLGTMFSVAQPGGQRNFDPEERAKSQTAELKEALGLNKDQEKKVYDINLESNKNMAKMRQEMSGGGGGFEGMREKFAKMREEQDKKMKAVLTEAQWGKYEKYQEERRSRRGQGRN